MLLAAVFVDPIYRITLTEEQQERGRKALLSIALDMKENEERKLRTNVENEGQSCSRNLSSASDSEDEDFEKHLDRQAKRRKMQIENAADHSSPLQQFKTNFMNALTEMEMIDRASKVNAVDAIAQYPTILPKVSFTVTALPPTQVTVEQLFSALRIIRSDLRASMKEDLLEAILFLRTNGF